MKLREKYIKWMAIILVIAYGVSAFYLYYNQSITDFSAKPILFESDLPLHISMIIEDGWYYSFTAYAYVLLYYLFGKSTLGIALLLAVATMATVIITGRLIEYLSKNKIGKVGAVFLSLMINFVMPIFVSAVGEFRYVSYQSPNVWHNSTYILMRVFAVMALLYYFKLEEKYIKGITLKEWIVFALLMVVTTGIKPSFLFVFSPIVGFFLLKDLIKTKSLKKILIFGASLLPSGIVILWQNAVLFGEETGNGVIFNPWYTFSIRTAIPKIAIILSALFAILVVMVCLKELLRDKKYLFIILMTGLGFLQALCLTESGSRSVDGNFLWGYSLCLYFLFVITAIKALIMKNEGIYKFIKPVLLVVFVAHLACGIYYYIELLQGTSYFMR